MSRALALEIPVPDPIESPGKSASPSRTELEKIAAELPRHTARRKVSEEELRDVAVDGRVEARVETSERAQAAALLRRQLLPALHALPAEDRLLLKLHCRDGLSI